MKRFLIIVIFLLALVIRAFPVELDIEMTGIRNSKGRIRVAVFINEVQFKKEQPQKSIMYDKSNLIDKKIEISICDLRPGIYGIAVLDDENDNGKLDYKLFIPCEGIGFSCYEHKLRKPDFSDFSFELKDGLQQRLKIQIKYIL